MFARPFSQHAPGGRVRLLVNCCELFLECRTAVSSSALNAITSFNRLALERRNYLFTGANPGSSSGTPATKTPLSLTPSLSFHSVLSSSHLQPSPTHYTAQTLKSANQSSFSVYTANDILLWAGLHTSYNLAVYFVI